MHSASWKGHPDIVELLLERGKILVLSPDHHAAIKTFSGLDIREFLITQTESLELLNME